MSTEASPEIFNYDDYRKYLKDWLGWKKQAHPGYSGAIFAKRAGLSSHTILGMVIRRDRNLSPASIRSFVRGLGVSGREALYFEKLVLFNQADHSDDKAYYLDQLLSISKGDGQKLLTRLRNHATYLGHWYIVAIREMVSLDDFNADPAWIASKLKNKVSKKEVELAWKVLLDLGMVARNPGNGKFEIVNPAIDLDPGVTDHAIRNYHKQFLKRAEDAVESESVDERELSSATIVVSEESLAVLKQKIKEFRKQALLEISASGIGKPTRVVALNTQLLVLTTD